MANFVHPTAIIEKGARLGDGNYIHPYVLIKSEVILGNDNEIFPFTCLGFSGEDTKSYKQKPVSAKENRKVLIGDNNVFREHSVVHAPLSDYTEIGHRNFFMHGSHVGHDVRIESDVVLSPNVVIGGYSYLGCFVNFGINSSLHQRLTVGPATMVGMLTPVTKSLLPGMLFYGNPPKYHGFNSVGIERAGLSEERIESLVKETPDCWKNSLSETEKVLGFERYAEMFVKGQIRKIDLSITAEKNHL